MTKPTAPPAPISPTGWSAICRDPLARVEGVGSLQVFGAEYAMRVWMDPTKLASYSLMPSGRPVGD